MISLIRLLLAPMFSLFFFVFGNGGFVTLIPLTLKQQGYHSIVIGMVGASYFAGLWLGSLKMEHLIYRFGHVRAFAAFAGLLSILFISHSLWVNPFFWMILRFMGGIANAGLFIVIESWLLLVGTNEQRGQVLSLYMLIFFAGQAAGQWALGHAKMGPMLPYIKASVFALWSIIPVALFAQTTPSFELSGGLSIGKLTRISPSGVISSVFAGSVLGSLYGMLPLYLVEKQLPHAQIATLMSILIFGGMCGQYPFGRWSDYCDRRWIMLLLTIAIGVMMAILMFGSITHLNLILFFLGAVAFTLYPISISHACDHLPRHQIVAGTQGLVVTYSIGAFFGPMLASVAIALFGSQYGYPAYLMGLMMMLGGFLAWRLLVFPAPKGAERGDFVPVSQASTPAMAQLNPQQGESGGLNQERFPHSRE